MGDRDIRTPFLIISAVAGESELLSNAIDLKKAWTPGKRQGFNGTLYGKEVFLLTTGPGTVNTAQSLGAALEHVRPGLIIQCGCAGVFHPSTGRIGDVGLAEREIDIHLGLEPPDPLGVIPDPLPFSILNSEPGPLPNTFMLNSRLVTLAQDILLNHGHNDGFNVLKGPFITVSTITATDERAERLYSAYAPLMESMEGSAAAQVAAHTGIPFLEIRSASNRVGKRDRAAWNLPLAFRNSAQAVLRLIEHLKTQD